MSIPTITPLPIAPQVTDTPSVFSQRANTFVAALGQLVTETNATTAEINQALAGALVLFDAYEGDWEAGSYGEGDVVRKDGEFYISLVDSNTQEPPGNQWQELLTAAATSYDNTASGLDATDVQAAIDEVQQNVDDFDVPIATTEQAQSGTDNETFITPLRMREGFNAGGSAPVFACRAWVNFNGIPGQVAIRASGNISSVTRLTRGDYSLSFQIPLQDSNYSASGATDIDQSRGSSLSVITGTLANSGFQVRTVRHFGSGQETEDAPNAMVCVFR